MKTSREDIRSGLVRHVPAQLVDELLQAHDEAKGNFYAGGLRLSAVEGGRFCEAAFRILEQLVFGSSTPLGVPLDTDSLIRRLAMAPRGEGPDSLRLHIPRSLRVVYDIRNKRDAAHLAGEVDPNLQDATLIVAALDWVLAEFVRLYHSVSPDEAHCIISELVTRKAPVIEDFDGYLKVLRPELRSSEVCAVLLYQRGAMGATFEELKSWVPPRARANLRRTLTRLVDDLSYVHADRNRYWITQLGRQEVERNGLINPIAS